MEKIGTHSQVPIAAFYSAIVDHIYRGTYSDFQEYSPKYRFNQGGILYKSGMFSNNETRIAYYLYKSKIIGKLHPFFIQTKQKDIDLMVAMIERSAKIFKERYQGKFYCLLWKERSAEKGIYAKILEGLKDKKVDVIEVEEIIPEYTQNYDKYLLYLDGHPNSFANARISEYLATFLEKENNHNVGISKSN